MLKNIAIFFTFFVLLFFLQSNTAQAALKHHGKVILFAKIYNCGPFNPFQGSFSLFRIDHPTLSKTVTTDKNGKAIALLKPGTYSISAIQPQPYPDWFFNPSQFTVEIGSTTRVSATGNLRSSLCAHRLQTP